eukprot:11556417-Ditylum_brightwellii.AAC.2
MDRKTLTEGDTESMVSAISGVINHEDNKWSKTSKFTGIGEVPEASSFGDEKLPKASAFTGVDEEPKASSIGNDD